MFDFPNAPTNGQLVQGGAGQFYAWDGAKWVGQMPPGPLPIASGGTGAITGALALDGLSGVSGATAGALQRSSGGVWSVSAVGGSTVVVSDTPPASPTVGSQWFDGVSATMFVWFNDGTSSQWVPVINQPGVGSPVSIANGGTGVTTAAAAPWVELVGDQMSGPLVINQNAAALPALTVPTQLTLGAANETGAELALVSFGNTSAGSQYQTYRSRGTAAARTAIQGPTDFIGQVRFNGYDGSAWGVGCAITGRAAVAGAWTGTNRQSQIEFWTVPPGSATLTNRMMIGDGLVVGIATDPGPGAIYAVGGITSSGMTVSNNTDAILTLIKPGTRSWSLYSRGSDGAFAILDGTAVAWRMAINTGGDAQFYGSVYTSNILAFDGSHYISSDRAGLVIIYAGGTALWHARNSDKLVFNNAGAVAGNGGYINLACFEALKSDIRPIPNAVALIEKLKPVAYTYNATREQLHGFVIEDMVTVYPETIQFHPDTHQPTGIKESVIIAGLTAAVQELASRVEALEAAS
jgi:hypothetical protein